MALQEQLYSVESNSMAGAAGAAGAAMEGLKLRLAFLDKA